MDKNTSSMGIKNLCVESTNSMGIKNLGVFRRSRKPEIMKHLTWVKLFKG